MFWTFLGVRLPKELYCDLMLCSQLLSLTRVLHVGISVGPEPDTTLIFSLIPTLISGNQVQGRVSKIRLFPDIRVMSDIRVLI